MPVDSPRRDINAPTRAKIPGAHCTWYAPLDEGMRMVGMSDSKECSTGKLRTRQSRRTKVAHPGGAGRRGTARCSSS